MGASGGRKNMRILAASNLQLDRDKKAGLSLKERIQLARDIGQSRADVILYLGNMAADYRDFMNGFEIIADCDASTRLFVLGNRDLLSLHESSLTNHYDEIQARVRRYSFHLLDREPMIVNGVGFVGNVGWYDSSLFKVPVRGFEDKTLPKTFPQAHKIAGQFFTNEFEKISPSGLTFDSFFEHCYQRIEDHLERLVQDPKASKIVVALHHAPGEVFLEYGRNEKWDFWNMYMGSNALGRFFNSPKVALGLTAKTARTNSQRLGRTRVYSVGLTRAPYCQIFDDEKSFDFKDVTAWK